MLFDYLPYQHCIIAPTVTVVVAPTRQVSTMSTFTIGVVVSGDGIGDTRGVGARFSSMTTCDTYKLNPTCSLYKYRLTQVLKIGKMSASYCVLGRHLSIDQAD